MAVETMDRETLKETLRRLGIPQYRWRRMTADEREAVLIERVLRDGRKRQMREALPDEPFRGVDDSEEPVLWFQKTFNNDENKTYTYITQRVRMPGGSYRWQIAVRGTVHMMTWAELCEFAMLRDGMPVFWRAVDWAQV